MSKQHLLLLKISIVVILAIWACVWILKPTQLWKRSWHVAGEWISPTFLGVIGLNIIVFCFPVLAAIALAYAYLSINSYEGRPREKRLQLMTNLSQPIITSSPFGILSLGELIVMGFIIFLIAWTYYSNVSNDFMKRTTSKILELKGKQIKLMSLGVRFGLLSEVCLGLLLLPILRRMAFLKIMGIQFEASVRYHIWIANGMMLFSLLHGAIIMIIWSEKRRLLYEITRWQRVGRVYLAGTIALVAGLIIWITSLSPIRRKCFEFFYYAHHLYLVFIIFFLLHAGDRHFYLVFSGVLLFTLDKIMRTIQSRQTIRLLSACILPCKAVQLTLRKPPGLQYTPMSILFVKIPSISKFQWHPFSIISSSNMDIESISILVKCQGQWTNSLYEMLESMANDVTGSARSLSVSLEGPYGPVNFSFRRYDRLILIAGGSGITPLMSILQDIASRDCTLSHCPGKINLIYVVKKSLDLSMLTPILILSHEQGKMLHLKLRIYVTQEERSSLSARELINEMTQTIPCNLEPTSSNDIMTAPEGLLWNVVITGLAFIVFLVFILCLARAFIHEEKIISKDKTPSWVYNLLVICSFIISTTSIIVATVVARWRRSTENSITFSRKNQKSILEESAENSIAQGLEQDFDINYGSRPNLIDLLSEQTTEMEENMVGVFVCGPDSMRESVAYFCKKYSRITKLRKDRRKSCTFVYNSINFSL